jgi:hypothetical protein
MIVTDMEFAGLEAIVQASKATTGTEAEGWWSGEILLYAKNCPLSPRQFAAVCGTLAKKGLVRSYDHEPGMAVIYPTEAGLDWYRRLRG